jgi:hypothetical protein
MPFIGNQPALSFTSFAKQDFSTSATTSYTLDNPVANANELALFINFVRQEPTTAYSASGTTLTLTSATASSDDMYCVYLGKAVQTVNPPNASVGTSQLVDGSVTSAKLASGAIANTPAFAVRKSGDQSGVGTASEVKITFETEIVDTDNAFASSKFTIPSGKAGKYVFYGNIRNNTGTDFDTFQIMLFKNGSSFDDFYAMYDNVNQASNNSSFSAIVDCAVGDYFEVYCYHNSGGNLSIRQNGSHFYGYKLIGV